MEKYENKCPNCLLTTLDISNYFSIKNTRRCEKCILENIANKKYDRKQKTVDKLKTEKLKNAKI